MTKIIFVIIFDGLIATALTVPLKNVWIVLTCLVYPNPFSFFFFFFYLRPNISFFFFFKKNLFHKRTLNLATESCSICLTLMH